MLSCEYKLPKHSKGGPRVAFRAISPMELLPKRSGLISDVERDERSLSQIALVGFHKDGPLSVVPTYALPLHEYYFTLCSSLHESSHFAQASKIM